MADRIVFLASEMPYPLDNGTAIRQFNLLQAYAALGPVDLLTMSAATPAPAAVEILHGVCATVRVVTETPPYRARLATVSGWRRRAAQVLSMKPMSVRGAWSPQLESVLDATARSAALVHVSRLPMAANATSLLVRSPRPRTVLDLDDIEFVARARQLRLGALSAGGKALAYYELARVWKYQAQMLTRFDRVFVCSEEDRRRLGRGNVVVVPNGAQVPAEPVQDRSDGRTLLYCGLLSYGPNIDAVVHFVDDVLPLIRERVPDVRLQVVGKTPVPEVMALADGVTVSVVPDVPSVEPYYRHATALVVPLRAGGGTRLKILEALALGTPVVSTSIGCEGLGVRDGDHLLIADGRQAFADACVRLLRDADLRHSLVARGRGLVSEQYSWPMIHRRVVEIGRDLLARPGGPRQEGPPDASSPGYAERYSPPV